MKGTTDIWFGMFLLQEGHTVEDYAVVKKGKGRYYFDLTEQEWKDAKIAFSKSGINELKMHNMTLKDFLY